MVKTNNELGKNATLLLYKLVDSLLYFNNNERGLRLYIPLSIE